MLATIFHKGKEFRVDFFKPIDISIPMRTGEHTTRAWYAGPVRMEPVRMGDWVGEVSQGGSVNFRDIYFNPHAHGTHTECVGHISKEFISVNQHVRRFMFVAEVITVLPQTLDNGDLVITLAQLKELIPSVTFQEALVIRTLGNGPIKLATNYSNTNPPYITAEAMRYINELGILHLLFDMPSVDREQDEGKLAAHHEFWHYPDHTEFEKTITEFIYVPNEVNDGTYLLDLQFAPFENDASPSRPVLYKIY